MLKTGQTFVFTAQSQDLRASIKNAINESRFLTQLFPESFIQKESSGWWWTIPLENGQEWKKRRIKDGSLGSSEAFVEKLRVYSLLFHFPNELYKELNRIRRNLAERATLITDLNHRATYLRTIHEYPVPGKLRR
jgi:hypothetical protein